VIGDRIELQIEAEAIRGRDATVEDSAQPETKEQTHADQE
jgi:hypothetical protein